jgi:hypothetical protein
MAVGALLAVLAVGAVATGVLGGNAGEAPAGTTTEQTTEQMTEAPPSIDLVAADYVGRPVAEVEAELTRLGLVPQLQPVQTADVPEGQVTAIDPSTALGAGSTVTLSHAVAPPPAPERWSGGDESDDDEDGGNGNGNGNGWGRGNDDD